MECFKTPFGGSQVEQLPNRFSTAYFPDLIYCKSQCFFFNFWRTLVLFVGQLILCFGLLVTSALGFTTSMDPSLACFIICVYNGCFRYPLVLHLLTSWWPIWQLSCLIHILAHVYRHWRVMHSAQHPNRQSHPGWAK